MKLLKGKETINAISKDEPILVLLYMDGCGYCEMLKPAWKDAIKEINKDNIMIIGEVESKLSKDLPLKVKDSIKGYPTIQVLQNGKIKKTYEGDRSTNDIVNFAKKHTSRKIKKEKFAGDCGCNKIGGKKKKKIVKKI
jgi:thiol-disulfide isomerase/thioredoxin